MGMVFGGWEMKQIGNEESLVAKSLQVQAAGNKSGVHVSIVDSSQGLIYWSAGRGVGRRRGWLELGRIEDEQRYFVMKQTEREREGEREDKLERKRRR